MEIRNKFEYIIIRIHIDSRDRREWQRQYHIVVIFAADLHTFPYLLFFLNQTENCGNKKQR